MPANAVYVGRPTKWGNPYTMEDGFTREECVEAYRYWLILRLNEDTFKYNLDELRGKDLVCWCPTDKPCHADVLIEIVESIPDNTPWCF
jgi:hypothetical protein